MRYGPPSVESFGAYLADRGYTLTERQNIVAAYTKARVLVRSSLRPWQVTNGAFLDSDTLDRAAGRFER